MPGSPYLSTFLSSFSPLPPPPPPATPRLSFLYGFRLYCSFIKGESSKIPIFPTSRFPLFSSSILIPSLLPSITLFSRCISSLYTLLLGLYPNLKFHIFPYSYHFALFPYPLYIQPYYNPPSLTLLHIKP